MYIIFVLTKKQKETIMTQTNSMKRVINIKPIKREFKNSRGYNKINWTCELEIIRFDGSSRTIKGYDFMDNQNLKRDAIEKANEYKNYLLSEGDFYFVGVKQPTK